LPPGTDLILNRIQVNKSLTNTKYKNQEKRALGMILVQEINVQGKKSGKRNLGNIIFRKEKSVIYFQGKYFSGK